MCTLTNKEPRIGDIWLVHFPYITPGNMEKVRPAIVLDFIDDKILVQKLTTRKRSYNKEYIHPKLKKKTYLSTETLILPEYNFVRYIGNSKNGKVKNNEIRDKR